MQEGSMKDLSEPIWSIADVVKLPMRKLKNKIESGTTILRHDKLKSGINK